MRYKRNAFAAKPRKFRGRGMHGVFTHPGFHTTDRFSVACSYANAKVDDLTATQNDFTGILKPGWRHFMPDYPVIVSLVMNGLVRLPDYDAFEYWAGPAEQFLNEFAQFGSEMTLGGFNSYLNHWESAPQESEDAPGSATDALGLLLDGQPWVHVGQRILEFLEQQPDPDGALQRIIDEPNNPVFLMHVAQQYRYLEDVPEMRICAVDYMRPFFDRLLPHYDDPEWEAEQWEKKQEHIEAAGYATVSLTDVYDDQDPTVTTRVYEVPPESIIPDRGQQLFPWGDRTPRVEYHGTSYVNLRAAAPRLARRLPKPPPPYKER